MRRGSPFNHRGQVLVLFVILLPVILLGVYALFSYFTLKYEQKNLNHIAEIACEYSLLGNSEEKVRKLILENDKDVQMEKMEGDFQRKSITLKKDVNSLFLNYKTTVSISVECSR